MSGVRVCNRGFAEVKISLPSLSPWHTSGQPQGPSICNFFSGTAERVRQSTAQAENGKYLLIYVLASPPFEHAVRALFPQVYNCSVVGQGKCDIDKGALWPKRVKNTCCQWEC